MKKPESTRKDKITNIKPILLNLNSTPVLNKDDSAK